MQEKSSQPSFCVQVHDLINLNRRISGLEILKNINLVARSLKQILLNSRQISSMASLVRELSDIFSYSIISTIKN